MIGCHCFILEEREGFGICDKDRDTASTEYVTQSAQTHSHDHTLGVWYNVCCNAAAHVNGYTARNQGVPQFLSQIVLLYAVLKGNTELVPAKCMHSKHQLVVAHRCICFAHAKVARCVLYAQYVVHTLQ